VGGVDGSELIERLRGGLIVSCQAKAGEPTRGPSFAAAFARAAELGGAVAVRVNGPQDTAAVRAAVRLPVIAIAKQPDPAGRTVITPSLAAVAELVEAGADLVAIETGPRQRPGGLSGRELVAEVRRRFAIPVMADVATLAEGLEAAAYCDLVATTLARADPEVRHAVRAAPPAEQTRLWLADSLEPPALDLVRRLTAACGRPVVAEGRFWTPEQVREAFAAGAHAVVVGTAITRPNVITARFVAATPRGAGAR
jgi:N-acylglucosamine-6-phosphate 2-epimerase